MSNKLTKMARELLAIEEDLPFRFDYNKDPHINLRPSVNDFEIYIFDQIWESTALGFGGIGGQAMTTATTYVLIPVTCNQDCFIYFAGRYAYTAPYSERLVKDVEAHDVASISEKNRYTKE